MSVSGKIRDRIAARFEEQDDLLAVGDPGSAEPHAHPSAQRLDVQTVSQAAVRAQGIGQSLPLRADIVARTVPLRSSIGLMIEAPDVASGIPDAETRIRRQGSP
jgi:hypothetical protein